MRKFRVLPQSKLDKEAFEHFPVWSEYYDYEEIEDVERWGLNVEEVQRQFTENSPGNEHCVYTLLESNPFPERMRIFIKASMFTSGGLELEGYIVNENAYCLTVFASGEEYIFSTHPLLAQENIKSEKLLAAALATKTGSVFPIKYSTGYRTANGTEICGSFIYGTKT